MNKLSLALSTAITCSPSIINAERVPTQLYNPTEAITQEKADQIARLACESSGYKFDGNATIQEGYDTVLLESTGIKNLVFSCLYKHPENGEQIEPANNARILTESGLCDFTQSDFKNSETTCYGVNPSNLPNIIQE